MSTLQSQGRLQGPRLTPIGPRKWLQIALWLFVAVVIVVIVGALIFAFAKGWLPPEKRIPERSPTVALTAQKPAAVMETPSALPSAADTPSPVLSPTPTATTVPCAVLAQGIWPYETNLTDFPKAEMEAVRAVYEADPKEKTCLGIATSHALKALKQVFKREVFPGLGKAVAEKVPEELKSVSFGNATLSVSTDDAWIFDGGVTLVKYRVLVGTWLSQIGCCGGVLSVFDIAAKRDDVAYAFWWVENGQRQSVMFMRICGNLVTFDETCPLPTPIPHTPVPPTVTATATNTLVATGTPAPTGTPVATVTGTVPTVTRTGTPTKTSTRTNTVAPTMTPTRTRTSTLTPTATRTSTMANTPTATRTRTGTLGPTPTGTEVPTETPIPTSTSMPPATRTSTHVPTATIVPPTSTRVPTSTPVKTNTPKPTKTWTPVPSTPTCVPPCKTPQTPAPTETPHTSPTATDIPHLPTWTPTFRPPPTQDPSPTPTPGF